MAKISLDLTGHWEFKEYPASARRMRDLDSGNWLKTSVPSSIYTSLIQAGQFSQSEIDTYPEKFAWVSEKPWVYRKTFDISQDLSACDRIDLVFDGLDTIASIWLNDKLLGKTNNMFIPFMFDITKLLKRQNNLLMVKFEPAVAHAKKLMSRYTSFDESDFINPYRVYIRKAQFQFSWDFCPALPGCGIWRPVQLEGTKKAGIADVHVRTIDCNRLYADIKIAVKLDTVTSQELLCKLTLSNGKKTIKQKLIFNTGEDFHSTVIRVEEPSLWWPAGYGQQHLYQLKLQLLSDDEPIDIMQKKIGIRIVKLNCSSGEKYQRFQFEVNGQPIFAKGANWIPASIFAGSTNSDDYEKLLLAAKNANMNMLRVWGGGFYEADKFYELCDELGIMLWQDFMFACAYYPDREWFAKEIKKEATAVIKRLRNHPSMVLWCGNNEIDWMHHTGKMGQGKKFYGKAIYHKLLPQLVAELDPDSNYIPTTPLDEKGKFKTGKSLTFHQWQVWSGHQPTRKYQSQQADIPPFVTEFGIQSMPDIETVKGFCPAQQMRIASLPIEKHNYQLDGNSRLYRYVSDLFGSAKNLEQFVYLSQITQARAVKTYVEHLRAHNLKNSGTLFWQFNDCSAAISWSAIDYTKRPKALYYYAKRFFKKILITAIPEFKQAKANQAPQLKSISAVAINDSDQPLTATLSCRLIDLFGNLLDDVMFPVAIGPFSISAPLKLPKSFAIPEQPQKCALNLLMENDGEKISENLLLYLPDKYIDWPKTEFRKRFSQTSGKAWKVKLKSNAIAKDVQLSTTVPAQLSDNFIDLIAHEEFELMIDFQRQVSAIEPVFKLQSVESIF